MTTLTPPQHGVFIYDRSSQSPCLAILVIKHNGLLTNTIGRRVDAWITNSKASGGQEVCGKDHHELLLALKHMLNKGNQNFDTNFKAAVTFLSRR